MGKFSSLSLLLLGSTALVFSQGTQFITGPCSSDADCASGCCGFNSGLCAGAIIALTRDGGCGRGDSAPNANAANALGQGTFTVAGGASTAAAAAPVATTPASIESTGSTTSGAAEAGNGAGTQFITGPCNTDADCASGCCGFNAGFCAGAVIALTRDGGCGHSNAEPNANAANSLGMGTFTAPTATGTVATATAAAAGTASTASSGSPSASSTNKGAGNGVGAQFITGPCNGDADCASGCCAFNTGKCAGPVVAQEAQDGGCGFGDAQPNNIAEMAITEASKRGLWDD